MVLGGLSVSEVLHLSKILRTTALVVVLCDYRNGMDVGSVNRWLYGDGVEAVKFISPTVTE